MTFNNVLQNIKPCVRLNKNKKGRDFIIGDIHGFYNDTIDLLDTVNFDPVCDRVFQCGDLTDRGPDSLSCLSLLMNPWFYHVHSNHDIDLVYYYFGMLNEQFFLSRSEKLWVHHHLNNIMKCSLTGDKLHGETADLIQAYIPALTQSPMMFHVADSFYTIHAQLYCADTEVITDDMLTDSEIARRWLEPSSSYAAMPSCYGLWSRRIWDMDLACNEFKRRADAFQCSPIYSGHTIQSQGMPVRRGSLINCDTGSFLRDSTHGVSIINHETQEAWTVLDGKIQQTAVKSL